jgi:uncharacterized protein (UPF0333 family)
MRRNQKAQSILEFSLVSIVVVVSLFCMQIYLKRGLMGRLRGYSEQLGEQYSPGSTTVSIVSDITLDTQETSSGGLSTTTSSETRYRLATESVSRD